MPNVIGSTTSRLRSRRTGRCTPQRRRGVREKRGPWTIAHLGGPRRQTSHAPVMEDERQQHAGEADDVDAERSHPGGDRRGRRRWLASRAAAPGGATSGTVAAATPTVPDPWSIAGSAANVVVSGAAGSAAATDQRGATRQAMGRSSRLATTRAHARWRVAADVRRCHSVCKSAAAASIVVALRASHSTAENGVSARNRLIGHLPARVRASADRSGACTRLRRSTSRIRGARRRRTPASR